jgi:hypothetical protein
MTSPSTGSSSSSGGGNNVVAGISSASITITGSGSGVGISGYDSTNSGSSLGNGNNMWGGGSSSSSVSSSGGRCSGLCGSCCSGHDRSSVGFLNKTTLLMLAPSALLYTVYIMYMFHYRHHEGEYSIRETLWVSSAGFVFLTFPISLRLIYLHLTHWVQPRVQKYIVRIIWMVPVYSIESWLALRFGSYALVMETLRECYEAYAIYSFVHFLLSLLGEEANLAAILKEKPASRGMHKWPFNLMTSQWIMGHDFIFKCKWGVFQYIVLKAFTAITTFVCSSLRLYGEGTWRFDRGYMYVFLIDSVSQLWALYCMIMFYTAAKEELTPWRPVGKFLCVKMVPILIQPVLKCSRI